MLNIATVLKADSPCSAQMSSLLASAVQGLVTMFHQEKSLFCYRLVKTRRGLEREGLSYRYTLISLMGLSKAAAAGLESPIPISRVLEGFRQNSSWITNAGDLGLYLWLCALHQPECLEQIVSELDVLGAANHYIRSGKHQSMELAWLLTGLSYARIFGQRNMPDMSRSAIGIAEILMRNQGPHGIFCRQPRNRSLTGLLRGRIGSFAEQVYPIYSLSKFAEAYNNVEALQSALRCARAICQAQGPSGEWWWLYDSVTGRVIGKYPVYSVHQEGMAPMALFAVSNASREDFIRPIFTGLEWIAGQNELKFDMRLESSHLVWRSFYENKLKTHANIVLRSLRLPASQGYLKVKYECRPYELGWMLYAFAPFYSAREIPVGDIVRNDPGLERQV